MKIAWVGGKGHRLEVRASLSGAGLLPRVGSGGT